MSKIGSVINELATKVDKKIEDIAFGIAKSEGYCLECKYCELPEYEIVCTLGTDKQKECLLNNLKHKESK